jgi:hypothetical protein
VPFLPLPIRETGMNHFRMRFYDDAVRPVRLADRPTDVRRSPR